MINKKFILLIILLFGFLLRVTNIQISPPALYGDELTMVLDSYSLYKTGHDQLGNRLPLTFQMGAGRPAGYVYGSIPFIAIFGPTALGVRGLSVLSGIGIIILLYLLGRRLFSEKVGLCAAFVSSVSIWDISLSRGGFEAHFALFLALLGAYLFICAKEKPILYLLSALSFGLILHTYPTYKISLLLFLPLLVWFRGVKLDKKYFFWGIVIFALLGILSLSQTFIGGSETRFTDINIFSQTKLRDSIEQKINFERTITKLPGSISEYFHNKPVEYTKVLIENYLQNFSMDFLLLHGDRNPRHNMATMGEIYFVDLILIFVGIINFWSKQKKIITFLLIWLFLAPIPTAIVDLPHVLRSAFMLPPLIIFSGLGLSIFIEGKKYLYIVGILFLFQFIFYIQKLYFLAPKEYSSFWSLEAKLASEKAIEEKDKYNFIFLSDKIDSVEFAYPVYAKVDPTMVIDQNKNKVSIGSYKFKKFGNVYISTVPETTVDEFLKGIAGKALYIRGDNFDNLILTEKL